MSASFELSIEVSEKYPFNKNGLDKIEQNPWVKNQWPLVYFIQNEEVKEAYVGESTNALSRIKNHLSNPERCKLNTISIIGSDKFNKSATLDIESSLIQYITADGTYQLQNGNFGLINHNYYQQDLYKNLFKEVWNKLLERRIVSKSLQEIENSEIFKYSPYKALNDDQYNSILEILDGLTQRQTNRIFVKGSAGTGKTILATYLVKLLNSDVDTIKDDLNESDVREIEYIKSFRARFPKAKIGLVIAMTSLRESLEAVFKKIPGLKASMIINPSETFKMKDKYDLLIVDEAHRLRQYKNIGWRGAFKKNNQKLGLDDSGTELDWILANSKNQIFFYDSAQSVKPSDVDHSSFQKLISAESTKILELKSQMRVNAGNDYIQFVDDILNCRLSNNQKFMTSDYELTFFNSFRDLHSELQNREETYQLCRLVAGYAWKWESDPKRKPPTPNAIDIEIEGLQFQWNQTDKDWINNPKSKLNPLAEIGCIHTVQGYDLNYTGVIFGKEIDYNPITQKIEIDSKKYFDKYGRIGATDDELLEYIINIYKTLMFRGIKGTFVYACNKGLANYLRQHMSNFNKEFPFRIVGQESAKPYVNCLPFVDIQAAAGNFSDLQKAEEIVWVEPPFNVSAKPGYFICQVAGESMNKRIPNGSYCLFKRDFGGSRNGSIVLVESRHVNDSDFGAGYTVKEYHSVKRNDGEIWSHDSIILKPLSHSPEYFDIVLSEDELLNFKVVGVFECVIM